MPTDSVCANLGLWTMVGYIDKCRLLFPGRLCNNACNSSTKTLFCAFLSLTVHLNINSRSICNTLLCTVRKYNLLKYVVTYVQTGYFPPKTVWCRIVVNSIFSYEEAQWKLRLSIREDMSRYSVTHRTLSLHRLCTLMYLYPEHKAHIQLTVLVGSKAKFSRECMLCNKYCYDHDAHLILHCESVLTQRNHFYMKLLDLLDVNVYVSIEMLDDEDALVLFCGAKPPIPGLDETAWQTIILHFSNNIYSLKDSLMYTF